MTTNRALAVTQLDVRRTSQKLRDFAGKDLRNALRRAMMSGARVVRDDARRRVPVRSGELKRKIYVRGSVSRDRSRITARVAIRRNSNARRYAHLVEFGTRPHSLTSGRRSRRPQLVSFGFGRSHPGTRARPFLRPALRENKDEILASIRRSIDDTVRRAQS